MRRIHWPRLRRRLLIASSLLLVLLGLWVARRPLLRSLGTALLQTDPPAQADAIFILAGNAWNRAPRAAELYHAGYAPVVYCLGKQVPSLLAAAGLPYTEAELNANVLRKHHLPDSAIRLFPKGTSTWEESRAIRRHAREAGFERILIVSSDFHTRRIQYVFRDFGAAGIDARILAASSQSFDLRHWWQHEKGVIHVNNEYVKRLYYWLKY